MIDNILVEDLADSPPQHWVRQIRQAAVLGRFDAERTSRRQVEQAASELNVLPRQVYALLDARRHRLAGRPASGSRKGCHYHIEEAQEEVIADAIAHVGPGGRLSEVCDEVQRLSRRRGVEEPSRTSVRTRFCRTAGVVDLAERLGSTCDLIVDLGELVLMIARGDEVNIAHLLAVFEAKTSIIVSHQLFSGRPTTEQMGSWLRSFAETRAVEGMPAIAIGLLPRLFDELQPSLALQDPWALTPASTTRKLLDGAAIHAAFGARIGRTAIRLSPRTRGRPTAFDPVPAGAASLVIERVIADRNTQLEAELIPRNVRKPSVNRREDRSEQLLEIAGDVDHPAAFN